ncbi:transglycosylase SLT domain-containing protein [Achromobacter sp.]|uniref:transglycosylase SLT domain-containing protein n=1 Tax=Achromobacter sp. TaxID=134375 RepID=UPI003CFCF698
MNGRDAGRCWHRQVMAAPVLVLFLLALGWSARSVAAEPAAVRIPDVPPLYRMMVEREAADVWGIQAPAARIAAQIHAESLWNPKAASRYAHGMAQFTPPTAEWIAKKFPAQLAGFDPWDPAQAVRAMVIYDHWLTTRNTGATACDTWAFGLSAYNGGEGWLRRDQRRALRAGAEDSVWFGHVAEHSGRAAWARRENRGYVSRILLYLEPAYVAAGWSGTPVCEALP